MMRWTCGRKSQSSKRLHWARPRISFTSGSLKQRRHAARSSGAWCGDVSRKTRKRPVIYLGLYERWLTDRQGELAPRGCYNRIRNCFWQELQPNQCGCALARRWEINRKAMLHTHLGHKSSEGSSPSHHPLLSAQIAAAVGLSWGGHKAGCIGFYCDFRNSHDQFTESFLKQPRDELMGFLTVYQRLLNSLIW